MMSLSSVIAASISSRLELVETRRTMSFCCASSVDSSEADMFGCGGNVVSIAVASFDFATDDGRVSGSKSAFRTRASLADRVVEGVEIAMVEVLRVR